MTLKNEDKKPVRGPKISLSSMLDVGLDPLFWQPRIQDSPSAWYGHVPFANWLVHCAKPDVLVELGTHAGVSYLAFCESVKRSSLPTKCFAVDSWEGDPQAGFYSDEVYLNLKKFNDENFSEFSTLIKSTFDEAQKEFEDGSIDILHIDGFHSYDAVRHDFQTWSGKLSDRAIVLFHDTNERTEGFGVWRYWNELSKIYPSFDFLHSHGLGVLIVGSKASPEIVRLANLSTKEIAIVRERFSEIGERWVKQRKLASLVSDIELISKKETKLASEVHDLSSKNEAHRLEIVDKDNRIKEYEVKEKELHALRLQYAEMKSELGGLRVKYNSSIELCASKDTKINSLILDTDKKSKELTALSSRIKEINRALLNIDYERQAILQSTSWKVTYPIRLLGNALKLRKIRRYLLRANSRNAVSFLKLVRDYYLVRKSAFFDRNWYLSHNPDVKEAGINPLWHYLRWGYKEGRSPSLLFNGDLYLDENEDVKISGLNPLTHFVRFGGKEERSIPQRKSREVKQNASQEQLISGRSRALILVDELRSSFEPALTPNELHDSLVLRFAIKIPAHRASKQEWGDFHFAESLAKALEKLGHIVRIDFLREWYEEAAKDDHIVISLRGLSRYEPSAHHINIMWNISHPDQVSYEEYDRYDLVYVASESFASFLGIIVKPDVRPLLQATDHERFNVTTCSKSSKDIDLLFVGNSRNEFRDLVKWSVEKGLPITVYGTLWEQFLSSDLIKGQNVDNRSLGKLYSSAKIVLNDHWSSMREYGILSNRLFDVVASGTHVISDRVPSITKIFGNSITQVSNADELADAVRQIIKTEDSAVRQLANEVLAKHTFDCRAEIIQKDLCEILGIYTTNPHEAHSEISAPALVQGKPLDVTAIVGWGAGHPQSSAFLRLHSPLTCEQFPGNIQLRLLPVTRAFEANGSDIVVVQRAAFDNPVSAERFYDSLVSDTKLIVDNDDGFCFMDESHSEYSIYKDRISALEMMVSHADRNWVSTQYLADAYAKVAANIEVIPNMLDPRIWRDYRKPRPQFGTNKRLRFLYMGTATHDADYSMILNSLDEANRQRPGSFEVTIIGAVRNPAKRDWLRKIAPPVGMTAYPRFVRWMLAQGAFDVGLAPLVDNSFNNCKSDLKFLDYAAMGVLPVLSDCLSYSEAAKKSAGAVLIKNDEQSWSNALINIIDNPSVYSQIIENASQYVWSERHVANMANLQWKSIRDFG